MVAGKAKHEEVLVRVIAAAQHGKPMMHLQLPLGAQHSADLAAAPARFDETAAPCSSQPGRPGPAVARRPHLLAQAELGQ